MPRAAPAPQHAHATTRAQQPASSEIRLDRCTIVCDDHHDDLQWRQGGPLASPRQGLGEGASNNRTTTILSPPAPDRHPASPPNVTLRPLAVTTQHDAKHLALPGRDSHPLATTSLCWITIYIYRPPALGTPGGSRLGVAPVARNSTCLCLRGAYRDPRERRGHWSDAR